MKHSVVELDKARLIARIACGFQVGAIDIKTSCIFITPDMLKLFFDCVPELANVEFEGIISIGRPIKNLDEITPDVGHRGMLGLAPFQVIRGENKCYVGIDAMAYESKER